MMDGMIHYRLLQPDENENIAQESKQLTVMSAFGSKQISFARSEARACTVPASNVHIGWNSYDKISEGVPRVTLKSGYKECTRLDPPVSRMGTHSDQHRRHIPMATVPKNGLICLTSFTDEKFSRLQQSVPTTEVFKTTKLPPAANVGINYCRSTSCHLVRDRFRRDLEKGQKILSANQRLDNLHAQITKQVGEGTRQLQEGILEYVDKISTCFLKKNSYSLGQPGSMAGSYLVEVTQGKEEREEKEEKEKEEVINNMGEGMDKGNNEEKETGGPFKERTSEQYVKEEEERRKEKDGEKMKEEEKEEKEEEAERRERINGVDINNGAKNEAAVTPGYQHRGSLQPLQESRQHKDNQNIQAQIEEGKMRTDFQYEIDSDIAVSGVKSTPKSNQKTSSPIDNSNAELETPRTLRRMTCPNIYLNDFSAILPDT